MTGACHQDGSSKPSSQVLEQRPARTVTAAQVTSDAGDGAPGAQEPAAAGDAAVMPTRSCSASAGSGGVRAAAPGG